MSAMYISHDRYGAAAERIASHCTQAIMKADAISAILTCLVSDPTPETRISAAECLALVVESGDMGTLAVLVQNGLPILLQQLTSDLISDVRRFCALAIRSCSRLYPEDVCNEDGAKVLISSYAVDASADVRVVCTEALAHLFLHNRTCLATAIKEHALYEVIRKRVGMYVRRLRFSDGTEDMILQVMSLMRR